MPDSTIRTAAESLGARLCECVSALDITDCLCFAGNNADLCCNTIYEWGFARDFECAGSYVKFLGTSQDSLYEPGCVYVHNAEFEIGVKLCPPTAITGSATKQLATWDNFMSCLSYLGANVHKCLTSALCCDNPSSGDIIAVSGISPDEDGFAITVGVRL